MIVEDDDGVEHCIEPDYGYAKEEPDCPPCGDSGFRRRRWPRGRRVPRWAAWARCSSCNPWWWQALAYRLVHTRRGAPGLLEPRRRRPSAGFDDEPPF